MSEEEIIERFNNGVQIHMRLSRLIQKQYKKEATEEKQRRFAVEQERDQLREDWKKEREISSRLHSDNTQLLQQNIQLQTEMQKLRDEFFAKSIEEEKKQQEQRRSAQQQRLEIRNSSAVSGFMSAISINSKKMKQFEIATTRQSVRTKKLKDRFEKLENDMEQMKKTAEETRSCSVVKNFSSAMLTNSKLISQIEMEQDQLREKLKKEKEINSKLFSEHTQLIKQLREFLQTETQKEKEQKSSSPFENFKSVLGMQNVDSRNFQLITEVERILNCHDGNSSGRQQEQKRSTPQQRLAPLPPTASSPGASASPLRISAKQQRPREEQQQRVGTSDTQLITKGGQMHNYHDENISGKYILVSGYSKLPSFLSSDNLECINYYWENNFDNLVHNISSYKKELFVWTIWKFMNATSGLAEYYANLLSLCRQWKRKRSDGEIHCLYYYLTGESPSDPDKELVSLLTTCNKCLWTWDDASLISAIRQYWPKFADSILSEEAKKEYPE